MPQSIQAEEPVLAEILKQHLRLRKQLIQDYIKLYFEGNVSAFGRSLELKNIPHRKTILRWASQKDPGLPKGADRLMALAQALDVDPFLLLDFDLETLMKYVHQASWNMSWGSIHKSLAFLNDLFTLSPEVWPPSEIAALFDGNWYTQDFDHKASDQCNYFQSFEIVPEHFYSADGELESVRNPQLWYLAFRDVSFMNEKMTPRSFWRPYAIIYIYQQQLILVHLAGILQKCELSVVLPQRFICETFFGQGSAQFRFASLHPFEIRAIESGLDLPTVRCDFPK